MRKQNKRENIDFAAPNAIRKLRKSPPEHTRQASLTTTMASNYNWNLRSSNLKQNALLYVKLNSSWEFLA